MRNASGKGTVFRQVIQMHAYMRQAIVSPAVCPPRYACCLFMLSARAFAGRGAIKATFYLGLGRHKPSLMRILATTLTERLKCMQSLSNTAVCVEIRHVLALSKSKPHIWGIFMALYTVLIAPNQCNQRGWRVFVWLTVSICCGILRLRSCMLG